MIHRNLRKSMAVFYSSYIYSITILNLVEMTPPMTQKVFNKISVFNLGAMLTSSGSCGFASYFRLTNYGNYCGLGGSGPITGVIDGCCYVHDACYRAMEETRQIAINYEWSYSGGGPYKIKCEQCVNIQDKVKCEICKCDRRLAICVEKAVKNGTPCP